MIRLIQSFLSAPGDVARTIGSSRLIVRLLVRRDILGRYRRSVFGTAWTVIQPLMMFAIYAYVFSVVFQVRFPSRVPEVEIEYGIILFSGLMMHVFLAEVLVRSPMLVLENVNFVRKVIFPLETLSVVAVLTGLFGLAINLAILLLALLAYGHALHPTVLLLPLVWAPFVLLTLGLSWFLASLGVFLRDTGQVIGILSTVLLFGSTILIPVDLIPEGLRDLVQFNPLTLVVDETRNLVLWGHLPDWAALARYAVVAIAVAWVGAFWFARSKKGFADVI